MPKVKKGIERLENNAINVNCFKIEKTLSTLGTSSTSGIEFLIKEK